MVWDWSKKIGLGLFPETLPEIDPRILAWDWSQKFALGLILALSLGLILETYSGIDHRNFAWDWSQRIALGLIPEICLWLIPELNLGLILETCSGIDHRNLVWDWSQKLVLGLIPERYSINWIPAPKNWCSGTFIDFWDQSHCTPKYSKGLIPEVNKWCSGIDPGTPFIDRRDRSRNAIKSVYFNLFGCRCAPIALTIMFLGSPSPLRLAVKQHLFLNS